MNLATADSSRHGRHLILGLLSVGLIIRVVLVWRGGQGLWPDETRYVASQDAVIMVMEGKVREGIASVVGQGDHPGFKLLGMIPAWVARETGVNDLRLPAGFFAIFSWTTLLLFWGCLRRAGVPPAAQAWAMAVAGLCVSLTFYSRHLLPYDAALALAMGALYVGWKEQASAPRTFAAGFLAGAALLVYLGYWLVVGVVLLLLGCRQREVWWRRLVRWAIAGAGLGTALLGVWLIDRLGEGTMIGNARRFSGTVTQGDFGQGYRLIAEYFWQAEGVLACLWLVATAWLTWRAMRHWRKGFAPDRAGLLGLLAVAAISGGLVVFSDLLPKFVVYGRTARQLAPFLAMVTGIALAEWLRGRRVLTWLAGVALAGNFAWQVFPVVAVGFPREFKQQAAAALVDAPAAEPGISYYRLVNVDQYVTEAEELPFAPEATLLAASHPYEFAPYLYEGLSARMRAQRRAADHRMRLVRMRVPPAMRITGERHGRVRMKLRFATGRAGMAEPLLSLGARGGGDLFFVRYLTHDRLQLGLECMGESVQLSESLPYIPGEARELELFSGSLLPSREGALSEAEELYYRNLVRICIDGVEVLRALAMPRRVDPAEVFAGFNFVTAGSANNAFSGEILSVTRGGLPPVETGGVNEYGSVRLQVRLPANAAGIPEPLVVIGVPGDATLAYVRVMSGGKIRVGIEIWGVGAYEGEAEVGSDRPVEIVISCPALFPATDAPEWKDVPVARQTAARHRFVVKVNGATALDQSLMLKDPRASPIAYGRNPVGGSLVSAAFTGEVLQVSRLPLAEP